MATVTTSTEPRFDHIDSLLDVPAVAEHLGIHKTRVYGLIQSGKLRAVNLGVRRIRVKPADLAAFIDAHTVGGH